MMLSLPFWANALFAPSLIWLLAKVNDEVDALILIAMML